MGFFLESESLFGMNKFVEHYTTRSDSDKEYFSHRRNVIRVVKIKKSNTKKR